MAIANIITDTLRAVATIASFMINDENAPFCFARYRLAMKNDRFILNIELGNVLRQGKKRYYQ